MHKNLFLSLFISSILFLAGAYFLADSAGFPYALLFVLLIAAIPISMFLGKKPLLVFAISCALYFLLWGIGHISTIYLHMGFLSLAIYFLWEKKGILLKGCGSPLKRIGLGIGIFFLMLAAAILANSILYFSGISDQAKIVDVVSSLPLYLIIVSFTLAPISEELFFRAFLVPRIGVPVSSILFALIHAAYGSIAELFGAFFLGFVLANAYYYLRDPLPCIIAHALFNLLSISIMFWVLG